MSTLVDVSVWDLERDIIIRSDHIAMPPEVLKLSVPE